MTTQKFFALEAKKEQLDDLDEGGTNEGDEDDFDDASGDDDEW